MSLRRWGLIEQRFVDQQPEWIWMRLKGFPEFPCLIRLLAVIIRFIDFGATRIRTSRITSLIDILGYFTRSKAHLSQK